MRPSAPRIAPLTDDELSDDQRQMVEAVGPMSKLNIFRTLVRHPKLYRSWAPFGGRLLQGSTIPARERELVILRVAFRCGSAYEWGQHVGIGRDAGLTDDEIRRVATGPDAPGWSPLEAAVLRAVDELRDDTCLTDETWTALRGSFDEAQMIELLMLAGHYALLAGVLNSAGVQTEGALPGLGEA